MTNPAVFHKVSDILDHIADQASVDSEFLRVSTELVAGTTNLLNALQVRHHKKTTEACLCSEGCPALKVAQLMSTVARGWVSPATPPLLAGLEDLLQAIPRGSRARN